ncbi:MAG TPA: protease pro-enzyme activation domain-containing protein [Chthonomonadaceae bacterium]|nr:protease pro-enzyme activation domain-containing protein [Chthonomonadaceae bacterium]
MHTRTLRQRLHDYRFLAAGVGLLLGLPGAQPCRAAGQTGLVRLAGHIPAVVQASRVTGRVPSNENLSLVFVLPFRNRAGLEALIRRLYDPSDPACGHYLSSGEFAARFAPTPADVDAVAAFAKAHGLTVTRTNPTRNLLTVSGPAGTIEQAFNVHLLTYQAPDGHTYHAPDAEPLVPAGLAARVSGIVGLSNAAVWRTHINQKNVITLQTPQPNQIGTGPSGALTPKDIETAYDLKIYPPANPADTSGYGKGQVLGLFELDGYAPSDILLYEQEFNLPQLIPTNEVVSPVTPTGGEDEVTLDIELQLAVAPLASQILVYMGSNTNTAVVQQYQQIADDNLAKEISTSWGATETNQDNATLNGENNAFTQMAAQGQTIFAASGDSGAYDGSSTLQGGNTTSLLVDDPASQPYMCGTGGTTLSVVSPGADEHYLSETTWGNPATGQGGGGGISLIWPIPWYQQGVISSASLGSTTMRNVPDVAFDADPNTGYDIVFGGTDKALIFGGTSCAAPIWAGFAARVNELRAANGLSPLGFANPALYAIGQSASYHNDFHDIADGSTNLYYPAVAGYDDATGWGSFIGANLITDLASPAPAGLQALAGDQKNVLSWSAASQAAGYNLYRAAGSGAPAQIATTTGTSYTDLGLVNGTTYSYYVQAVYAGGSSALAGPSTATPAVVALTGGPYVSTQSGGQATITWSTNVVSNSTVHYGTSKRRLSLSQASSSQVVAHSITLSSLKSGTTYYFSVASNDGFATASSTVYSFTDP